MESERKNAKLAQEKLALDYAERSKEIEASLQERQQEIQLLQKELRNVKEFRRNKVSRDLNDFPSANVSQIKCSSLLN